MIQIAAGYSKKTTEELLRRDCWRKKFNLGLLKEQDMVIDKLLATPPKSVDWPCMWMNNWKITVESKTARNAQRWIGDIRNWLSSCFKRWKILDSLRPNDRIVTILDLRIGKKQSISVVKTCLGNLILYDLGVAFSIVPFFVQLVWGWSFGSGIRDFHTRKRVARTES